MKDFSEIVKGKEEEVRAVSAYRHSLVDGSLTEEQLWGEYNQAQEYLGIHGKDSGADIELINLAASVKSTVMLAEGIITVPEGCLNTVCLSVGHILRLQLSCKNSQERMSKTVYNKATKDIDHCSNEDCPYHPDFDRTHRPREGNPCNRDRDYLPDPTAG